MLMNGGAEDDGSFNSCIMHKHLPTVPSPWSVTALLFILMQILSRGKPHEIYHDGSQDMQYLL